MTLASKAGVWPMVSFDGVIGDFHCGSGRVETVFI